jgi:hypothetical protein
MTAASTIAGNPAAAARRIAVAIAARPLLPALIVTALVTALRMNGTVDSDVAWQLWIAGRIHAGANLYRDIIETNPPLWFWMALPVERLAALLHLRVEAVLVASIGWTVALSLVATERLIGHIAPLRRALLLVGAALTLAAMPWAHVGQREQIVLIGALPYAALIAARREGKRVPPLLAALIGLGAALGFALKHYFLIVPALLELWLIAGGPRRWRPIRAEIIALVATGSAYAAAIAFIEPDFVTTIVPLLRLAYDVFGAPSLRYLFGPFAIAGLLLLALLAGHARALARAPLAAALFIACIGFTAVYFIQSKGWPYHAIPLVGLALLALAALLAECHAPLRWLRLMAPGILVLPFYISADEALHPSLPAPDVINAVSGLHKGDPVAFVTTESAIPWSVTLQGGYRYASRYNGFWMMRAILRDERLGTGNPDLAALGNRIRTETVADFTCIPPRRIIVWRPRRGEDGLDILPFFLRDPSFAALLSHYRLRSRTSLETYELVSPVPRPTSPCRSGV